MDDSILGGTTQNVNIENDSFNINVNTIKKTENEIKMDIAIKLFANLNFSDMTEQEIMTNITNICRRTEILYNIFKNKKWL